jgi:hypothetical protein
MWIYSDIILNIIYNGSNYHIITPRGPEFKKMLEVFYLHFHKPIQIYDIAIFIICQLLLSCIILELMDFYHFP